MKINTFKQLSLIKEEGVLLVSIDASKNRFRGYYIHLGTTEKGEPYISKKWGRVFFFKNQLFLRRNQWLSEETRLYRNLDDASSLFQSIIKQKLRKGYYEFDISNFNYSTYEQLSLLEHLEEMKRLQDQSSVLGHYEFHQMELTYA